MTPGCPICKGEGWVCENHPYRAWTPEGCQCGPGMPCECNPNAEFPPDSKVIWDTRKEDHA